MPEQGRPVHQLTSGAVGLETQAGMHVLTASHDELSVVVRDGGREESGNEANATTPHLCFSAPSHARHAPSKARSPSHSYTNNGHTHQNKEPSLC